MNIFFKWDCNRVELLASCSAFDSLEVRSNSFIKLIKQAESEHYFEARKLNELSLSTLKLDLSACK